MRGGGPLDVTGRRCRGRKWAGEGYKSPPPSVALKRGPQEARSAVVADTPRRWRWRFRAGSRTQRRGQRAPDGEDPPRRQARRRALSAAGSSRRGPAWTAALSVLESVGTRPAGRVALTMVSCWDTVVLLCALLGCLLLSGEALPRPGVWQGWAASG